MRGGIEEKRSPVAHGGVMRGGVDVAGAGTGSGGKRGDACLAEIQRLEKNRANRRNRMEKARWVQERGRACSLVWYCCAVLLWFYFVP